MDFWTVALVIAVAVVALELVSVWRRGVASHLGYFGLLAIDAALLGYTMSEPRFRFSTEPVGPWPELAAGVLLCALIVVVPALCERWMRRALAVEKVGTAARLAAVREILQPGRATTAERELYAELGRVQAGHVEEVVRALRARLVDAEPPDDVHLHDRIITALAFGRRYREAATHYETHVRSAPSLHPGLAIQMVRAYGELGDLGRAAQLVHRLEQAAREREPGALLALTQARLFFLAYAGGAASVEKVLAQPAFKQVPPRLAQLVREAARASVARPDAGEPELVRFTEQVAARTVADASAERAAPPPTPSTATLIAMNVIAFGLFVLLLGDFSSAADVARAGGSLHPAVRAGEWWRLWTAMFLHGGETLPQGLVHLGLNMYGLYLLGRIVEPLLGWIRFTVVYCVAGLVGNVLSAYNPRPEAVLSIGASGAVMGLMGALLVLLVAGRDVWPEAPRRTLVINLVVLVAAQIGVGFFLRRVDNFAHIGGFLGGAAATLVVMPRGRLGRGRFGRVFAIAALGALAASATASVFALARSRLSSTMAKLPRRDVALDGVTLSLPSWAAKVAPPVQDWPGEETAVDEVADLEYAPHVVVLDGIGLPTALARCAERDRATSAKLAKEEERPEPTMQPIDAPPIDGWIALAQRATAWGRPASDMLYYGRVVDGKKALVVEVNYLGRRPFNEATRRELARALASAR